VSDPDPAASSGVAIIAVTGRGTWQYSRDGGPWLGLGPVSPARARLLRDTDLIRFVPDPIRPFNGVATITYRAWDQSNPTATTADLSRAGTVGGRTPYSQSVRTARLLVNDAPVLTPPTSPPTGSIAEDTRATPGYRIDALVPLTSITDPDPLPLRGVAVVAAAGNGTWQYSLNNGLSWLNFGSVSESAARLLRPTDRVRFLPARDWNGQAILTYRAWDRTLGTVGGTLDTSLSGVGAHWCCSAATADLTITVTPVNDAPVLPTSAVSLSGANTAEGVDLALMLLLAGAQDADGDPLGMAITGLSGGGTWQYSVDGDIWQTLGSLSTSSALLLGAGGRLRVVPSTASGGTAWLTLRAWDGTAGSAGDTVDLRTIGGGWTAFSSMNRLATLFVE
jgi:hypothetical protein